MKVNDARQELFSTSRQLDSIPPTRAALEQHVRRAVFQGGYVWGQTLHPKQVLPTHPSGMEVPGQPVVNLLDCTRTSKKYLLRTYQ